MTVRVVRERGDRRHRGADVLEIGLELRVFPIAHGVVAADRAIELVGDHERQRGFLAAVDLPSMIQHMYAGVRRRRHH